VAAVDLLDPKAYFTGKPRLSKRHRVRDNLLGTGRFSPVIRRTPALEQMLAIDLAARARDTVGRTGGHLIARAASFMLQADSRASFQIEGERPARNRLERWGRAVLQAGRNRLTLDEIIRLHGVLVEDTRFVRVGLRTDGVFVGQRDHVGDPMPEFIGARAPDLPDLMAGMLSSVMLDRIDDYRTTLQAHSGPLTPFIEWPPTPERNVEVLNDTADLYRYFDCTKTAECLYECVRRTVEDDLPREIEYLRRHDEALQRTMEAVEMPDRVAENLVMFIRQNRGALSRTRREVEFRQLSDDEVRLIERIVGDAFAGFDDAPGALGTTPA